jgi:hypothetical protein
MFTLSGRSEMRIGTMIFSRRGGHGLILILGVLFFTGLMGRFARADLWLAAVSPVTQKADHWNDSSVDYMDLFRPEAPWPTVAAHLQVFKIGPGFASQGSEADLKRIFSELRRRKIALALEIGALTQSARYPKRSEASGKPGGFEKILTRVRDLGGDVQYIAMDEPLVFGRWQEGLGPNKRSMSDLTQNLAQSVATAKRIFPGVQIGDEETVSSNLQNLAELEQWPEIYRQAVGQPLAFLHIDTAWSAHAMQNLVPLAKAVQAAKVPLGIIYNGGSATSDESWARESIAHAAEIETDLGVVPQDAIFQTWVQLPTHLLPETRFGTLTNLAYRYLQPRSRLTIQETEGTISGTLTTESGRPIANAPVSVEAIDVGGKTPPAVHEIADVVPPGARTAFIGIRINTESSHAASGAAVALIGPVQYLEAGSSRPVVAFQEGAGSEPKRYATTDNGKLGVNSPTFPVTPGASFSVTFRATVAEDSEAAGFVSIIFKGDIGKGDARRMWRFEPNRTDLAKVTTDANGAFTCNVSAGSIPPGAVFRVSYDGGEQIRGSIATTRP